MECAHKNKTINLTRTKKHMLGHRLSNTFLRYVFNQTIVTKLYFFTQLYEGGGSNVHNFTILQCAYELRSPTHGQILQSLKTSQFAVF